MDTTAGRLLLWDVVPEGLAFDLINRPMVKSHFARD